MNDKERISRLVGAAVGECSSSGLAEVRGMLVRAMKKLGDFREDRTSAAVPIQPSLSGMTRRQRDAAVRAIEDMIEEENSKSRLAPKERLLAD